MTRTDDGSHSDDSASNSAAVGSSETDSARSPVQAPPKLIRIGELSEMIGIPHWTLRRYANAGQIPVARAAGQQRRFDPDRVRAALAQIELPHDPYSYVPDPVPSSAAPVEFDRAHPVPGEITPTPAEPKSPATWEQEYRLGGLEEHLVWRDAVAEAGIDTDRPAGRLMEYSLEEMVNNAIDHSGGTHVTVGVWSTPDILAFHVTDDGEGAFAHLRKGLGLENDFDAIAALTKGKQTTWRERHSGEGIFFTSKMVDLFKITANGKTWTVDNSREDQSVGITRDLVGTRVYGQVDPGTARTSAEVFARFANDDHAFTHTRPSVKLASLGLRFASRSEARRLMAGLDEFSEIDIDFAGVSEVGQGFTDEVFRVWAQNHPDKTLNPINMNPAVEFMVHRGLASS